MGVFCDRLKLRSTAALDCQIGQNKDRYHEKELSFLLVLLNCSTKLHKCNWKPNMYIGIMYVFLW